MKRLRPVTGQGAAQGIPGSRDAAGFAASGARADYHALCSRLVMAGESPGLLSTARAALETRLAELAVGRRQRPEMPVGAERADTSDRLRYLLPWVAGAGAELRRIAQAGTGHRVQHALLFGIYIRCYAPGSPSDHLRAAAHVAGDDCERAITGVVDTADQALSEAVFLRLSLGCFPEAFFPEILGYVLADVRGAAMQCSRLQGVARGQAGALQALETRARCLQVERPALAAAWRAARHSATGASRHSLNARIVRGMALHESLTAQVWRAFEAQARNAADVAGAMQRLLLSKAPFATGYHRDVMMGGRSLDAWFGDRPFQADAFLAALGESPWIDREVPEHSRLLALFRFGGPMFGVLSAAEEAALRSWLAGLARPVSVPQEVGPMPAVSRGRYTVETGDAETGSSAGCVTEAPGNALLRPGGTTRDLFHALVNPEQQPGAVCAAHRYVQRCLRRVARDPWHRWARFPYSEAAFETWLNALHRRQIAASPKRPSTPKLSRAAYVFGIEQLAPSILVDGCWLQRVDGLAQVSPGVARRLTAIHADELGNGNVAQNHPWIYRRLLESLGIDCPPVESIGFAANPRFLDAAFELPVLLLSIAAHTYHRFLPELLGLNLAIEVSGLGAHYGQVVRDLVYWGIDAHIVRLHQSIDNLASGHAALARDAIVLNLREVHGLGGEAAEQSHWQRIQCGYDLLRVVTRPFKWRLVTAYLTAGRIPRLSARVSRPRPTGASGSPLRDGACPSGLNNGSS